MVPELAPCASSHQLSGLVILQLEILQPELFPCTPTSISGVLLHAGMILLAFVLGHTNVLGVLPLPLLQLQARPWTSNNTVAGEASHGPVLRQDDERSWTLYTSITLAKRDRITSWRLMTVHPVPK